MQYVLKEVRVKPKMYREALDPKSFSLSIVTSSVFGLKKYVLKEVRVKPKMYREAQSPFIFCSL